MTAQALDLAQVALAGVLCVAVTWRGLVAHRLGELWWCCVSVAISAVLAIDAVAAGLDDITDLPVSGLLARLAAVSAVALAVRWLLRHRDVLPGRHRARPVAPEVVVAVTLTTAVPTLVVTWLPDAPAGPAAGPTDVLAGTLHWGAFAGFLLASLAVFLRLGLHAVDTLPAGRLRASLLLMLVAAAALVLWVVTGTVGHLSGQSGHPTPDTAPHTLEYLLTAVFALFAAAVLAPLTPCARKRPLPDEESIYAELVSLWTWTTGSPAPPPPADGEPSVDAVLDLVIEVRDQFHDLQRFLTPAAVGAAQASSRPVQLSGVDADAWTAAVCLELASAARLRGEPAACAGVDLSSLGGGDCLAAEAAWLARVSFARRAGAAGTARRPAAVGSDRHRAGERVGTLR